MKRIIIILFILFIELSIGVIPAKASGTTIVHYVFDKLEVNQGENFTLTILLENYSELSSFQFVCLVNEEYFKPLLKEDVYFQKPIFSLFDEKEVYENSYDKNTLRFVGMTKGLKTYGYSSLNNIFKLTFKATQNLQNIEQYFYPDMEEDGFGSRTTLTTKWLSSNGVETKYSEELKITWLIDKYTVKVYDRFPEVLKDIKINNRSASMYKIEVLKEGVDLSKIGSQVIQVKIYDYVNTMIVYLGKTIEVLDQTPPVLEVTSDHLEIDDFNLKTEKFEYYTVTDNYDEHPLVFSQFFDYQKKELLDEETFKMYLSSNLEGYLTFYALDSSNNQSPIKEIKITILDKTPPKIKCQEDIIILDTEIDQFKIEDYLTITDQYDKNPRLLMSILGKNDQTYYEIKEALNLTGMAKIKCYAEDYSGNISEEQIIVIKTTDTTPPIIKNVNNKTIIDSELIEYLHNLDLFEKDIIIKDREIDEVVLLKKYYNNNREEVEKANFISSLKTSLKGYIVYLAQDAAGNLSQEVEQEIILKDTLPPQIIINNLENNHKYVEKVSLSYEIIDLVDDHPLTLIFLNDIPFEKDEIAELGDYVLKIQATDKSGNAQEVIIEFSILKKNFLNCLDSDNCDNNNQHLIIYSIIGLITMVGGIVVLEVIYLKKKKSQNRTQEETS